MPVGQKVRATKRDSCGGMSIVAGDTENTPEPSSARAESARTMGIFVGFVSRTRSVTPRG